MGRRRRHDKHLPSRMYRRGASYYFVEPGTERWQSLGPDYVTAMRQYADLTAGDVPVSNMGDLIDRYLREVAPHKAESTYRDNLREAKNLKVFFGRMPLTAVKPLHVYQYLEERGKKARTRANREVSLLGATFRKAVRWGLIEHWQNPCQRIEKPQEKARTRYIEDWEFHAFKQHAPILIAAYMDVKYLTGLRQADLLGLRLDQLRDDGIHVTVGKTGKRIIIEWSDTLRAAVAVARRIPGRVKGLFLFSNRLGQPYTGDGFRSIWQRAMKSALDKGVLTERFREHDIRAKAASDAAKGQATALLAHLDARTTERHYRRKPETVAPLK